MKFSTLLALVFVCLLPATLSAQAGPSTKHAVKDVEKEIKLGEDEPGCKDSSLLPRMPGCSIIQCDTKPEAEGIELQIGVTPEGVIQKEPMDGAAEVIYYLCPFRMQAATIVKNAEANLIKAGFKVVTMGHDNDDMPIVTAAKDLQWIQVSTYMYNDNAAYIQTAIKVAPEDAAAADAMAEEMSKNGRVVLTSLTFNKDELTPEDEKPLNDVLAFLLRQPDLRIRVEGHTDNIGDKQENLVLSQKRAGSVASWFLSHGIDKMRVSIAGFGDSKPVTDNSTPEGQAKNRRIELVRF